MKDTHDRQLLVRVLQLDDGCCNGFAQEGLASPVVELYPRGDDNNRDFIISRFEAD